MTRHYLNNSGFYKLAQSIKDYINRKITGYDKLGTASTKDFTTYVSPTQTEQLPISSSVYSAMTNMLRGAYHPAGSKTIAELTSDLLVKANLGNVYKITEDGVTSNLFIGGAGQTIKTGDNAVVLYASEDTYMFSLESGVVDLDAYQKKELTSGALIEDVIPTDASASNQLVTVAEKIPSVYYNADTNMGDEANRKNAIGYVLNNLLNMSRYHQTAFASIRYLNGYYSGYVFQYENANALSIIETFADTGYMYTWFAELRNNVWVAVLKRKLVTGSDLSITKMDISATSGSTSFSATIPLTMAQRNKPFYLEVLSVGNSNAIKEMKYIVFVSSTNTTVTTKEISKDSIFTNVSINFNASTGYELSFSSTELLYSNTVYVQQ